MLPSSLQTKENMKNDQFDAAYELSSGDGECAYPSVDTNYCGDPYGSGVI